MLLSRCRQRIPSIQASSKADTRRRIPAFSNPLPFSGRPPIRCRLRLPLPGSISFVHNKAPVDTYDGWTPSIDRWKSRRHHGLPLHSYARPKTPPGFLLFFRLTFPRRHPTPRWRSTMPIERRSFGRASVGSATRGNVRQKKSGETRRHQLQKRRRSREDEADADRAKRRHPRRSRMPPPISTHGGPTPVRVQVLWRLLPPLTNRCDRRCLNSKASGVGWPICCRCRTLSYRQTKSTAT